MVLTRKLEKVVEGKNGFICLVDRSWQKPGDRVLESEMRGPFCVNARRRSVLPVNSG
jgi:hypothetical protein